METFDVAHIREQGVDLVIVLLNDAFGRKTQNEQRAVHAALQRCATAANLAGTVVPVWPQSNGGMGFIAPQRWHPFFRSISPQQIYASVNRQLTCG